jgi:hypothetical protein
MYMQEPIEVVEAPAHFEQGVYVPYQKLKIYNDDDPQNPRTEWDNFGHMVAFHRRYMLGDEGHGIDSGDFDGWDELEKYLVKEKEAVIVLPLYLFDHSGITINTTGFSCPWDSGQVEFTYVTRQEILDNWQEKRLTKDLKERARSLLIAEVQNYDDYLNGNVYGYVLEDEHGDEMWSCWGYSGDDAIAQIKSENEISVSQPGVGKALA